jgi:hypothetical protein
MQGIRLRLGSQKRAIAGAACPESIAFLATLPNDAALSSWAFSEGCSLSSLTRSPNNGIPLETDPLASALKFLRSGPTDVFLMPEQCFFETTKQLRMDSYENT